MLFVARWFFPLVFVLFVSSPHTSVLICLPKYAYEDQSHTLERVKPSSVQRGHMHAAKEPD